MADFFRGLWGRAPRTADRRRACRYPAGDSPVYLGWWRDDEFRTTLAILVDVSGQGASVLSSEGPSTNLAWLCPCQTPPAEWVEARAVAVECERSRIPFRRPSYKVRLEFAGPCSFELFKSSTGTRYSARKGASNDDALWGRRR